MGRIVEEMILEEKKNMALQMLEDKLAADKIAKYVNLPVEEIQKLAKDKEE